VAIIPSLQGITACGLLVQTHFAKVERDVPLDPALRSGVKGHNINETALPRSSAL
jgi:hypothetical protein